jgi:uncharacterized protein
VDANPHACRVEHRAEVSRSRFRVSPLFLIAGGFSAGFVDAVVGGGGLIQLPIVTLALPRGAGDVILATNKFAGCAGTSAAAITYRRRLAIGHRLLVSAAAVAFVASFAGARLSSSLPKAAFRPAIIVLLIAVAIATWRRPDLAKRQSSVGPLSTRRLLVLAATVGVYDGVFGPGTGMLFTFGLVTWVGLDFLSATGTTKLLNATTNVAALAWFIPHGAVSWRVALPLATCNLVGGIVGSQTALARGTVFVRRAFLLVVVALIARLMYDSL